MLFTSLIHALVNCKVTAILVKAPINGLVEKTWLLY